MFFAKVALFVALLGQGTLLAQEQLQVAILGLGGRAQQVLTECLKLKQETHKDIRVVAVSDDYAKESLGFYIQNCLPEELLGDYQEMFQGAQFYPDDEEGLSALFSAHPHLDRILITSPNFRHFAHVQAALDHSSCDHWYLEKPLFRTLEEFSLAQNLLDQKMINVGLTLRYALITKLVLDKLQEYGHLLGKLQKVHSWEHVNFGHSLTIIMMNWRRYASLSGGLLIEKSIHDADLALYFMQALGYHPESFTVSTKTSHDFFKKSNQEAIKYRLLSDETLRKGVELWDQIAWQRIIPFSYDETGAICWNKTIDQFFQEFPEDEKLKDSDIIPDHHELSAKLTMASGEVVDFTLDVKLNGFSPSTDRGCKMFFDEGEVEVDVRKSKVTIRLKGEEPIVFDLRTKDTFHAGGDVYIAHTLLGSLPEDNLSAEFSDPSLQLSTLLSLLSEEQARKGEMCSRKASKVDGQWIVEHQITEY